jgi:hypothetical protein
MGLFSRVRDSLIHAAFNTFAKEETNRFQSWGGGSANYGSNPSRLRSGGGSDRTITTSIYNQIAMDVASADLMHVRLDEERRYKEPMGSGLNYCLTVEANLDEGARAFRQNIAMTLFEKGVAAVCIMTADKDPATSMSYDIETLRVGEVVAWYPEYVRVLIYNQETGMKDELTLPKRQVAIIENPLYAVMNDEVSTLRRLTRKLSILDAIDEQAGSGKLDIIIQLPYVVKSDSRKAQAAARRQDMEDQLYNSKYGVAYADATEKITQLNRPAENNMLAQVEFLTKQLYSQLGIPKDVFDGTADEKTLKNYHNRTVEPVLTAIAQGIERKFLSKTARAQGQAVRFFIDPFRNITLADLATLVDSLSRNEILSPNEIRTGIGFRPSKEAKSDMLLNSNMPGSADPAADPSAAPTESDTSEEDNLLEETLAALEANADKIISDSANV